MPPAAAIESLFAVDGCSAALFGDDTMTDVNASLAKALHGTARSLPCDRCVGRTLNICKPLDPAQLLTILGLGGVRRWKAREIMFRAGDPMGAFFKIRSGIAAVSRGLDDGRRQIVALRVAGDCVGYLETDGKYAFEGEALTDVEACAFDRRRFDAFAAEQPHLASAVAEALSSALKQTGEAMLMLGQLKSTERVAHFLAEFSALYHARTSSSTSVSLRLSRREIADCLGLTVETVSRAIGELRDRRLIDRHGLDTIVILDNQGLRRIGKVRSMVQSDRVVGSHGDHGLPSAPG